MIKGQTSRRLAAILAADVADYTRLMETNESETLSAWWNARNQIIDPLIAAHGGRIVKHTGDGFLAEFSTATQAVECAVAMQQRLKDPSENGDPSLLRFRMGINIGEIVVDHEDIYGAGVNLAARIETLADPGGVWVSKNVYEQVNGRLDVAFEDMGAHSVKNVAMPVHVYRAVSDKDVLPAESLVVSERSSNPSVAVLPFENMSGDPEQEYFSDGISEDIITALSRFHDLIVIARNSSFTYRGAAVDIRKVGRELNARYVLEGSVRKAGNRIRVTAQLIESETANHVWAERYDRLLEDIFEVQDEITECVAAAVGRHIARFESEQAGGRSQRDLGAWDLVNRAEWHMRKSTAESLQECVELCQQCIDRFPDYAPAYSALACAKLMISLYGFGDQSLKESSLEVSEYAGRAVAIDPADETGRVYLGWVLFIAGKHDEALEQAQEIYKLNPNIPMTFAIEGMVHAYSGQSYYDQAIECLSRAMRLSPKDNFLHVWYAGRALADAIQGRLDDALSWVRQSLQLNPSYATGYRIQLCILGHQGDQAGAQIIIKEAGRYGHTFNLEQVSKSTDHMFRFESDREFHLKGLRLAGVPERGVG